MKYLFVLCFCFSMYNRGAAQYQGGSGHGHHFGMVVLQPLGVSFHIGGAGKGSVGSIAASRLMGHTIYTGGNADGFVQFFSTNAVIGFSVFLGGDGKGNNMNSVSAQLIGFGISNGGEGQGVVSGAISNQLIGVAIYVGGSGDGFSHQVHTDNFLGPLIYAGGNADGSITGILTGQAFGAPVFSGGGGKGDQAGIVSSRSLGVSISSGGNADGVAVVTALNNTTGEHIFTGSGGDGYASADAFNRFLPVSLFSISATWPAEEVYVKWTTVSETNNDHFVLQRSNDAVSFTPVSSVAGKGNSTVTTDYQYADADVKRFPDVQTWYYRLESVSFNHISEISNVVSVSKKGPPSGEVYVFPNPTTDMVQVVLNTASKYARIVLCDAHGKELINVSLNNFRISLSHLPPGAYYMKVTDDDGSTTQHKIILTKP